MDAARWGSIRALHFLSTSSQYKAEGRLKEQTQNAESTLDQHDFSIKALEYLFVAELRGDNYAAPNSVERLMDRLTYTNQDVAQACHQAANTYATLESQRLSEGKAPFENLTLPGIDTPTNYSLLCES